MNQQAELTIIAVTRAGSQLAARLATGLAARALVPQRFVAECAGAPVLGYAGSALAVVQRSWGAGQPLVLVMAAGVALRALAPLMGRKSSDPAVVCLDEAGRWVIPLLGGHAAGANQLAERLAALSGGVAVITTASDGQGKPALDLLGQAQGWRIAAGSALTYASACLVNDAPIGLWIDPALLAARQLAQGWLDQAANLALVERLDDLSNGAWQAGLIVSHRHDPRFAPLLERCVLYRPPVLVAGMGCQRGVPAAELHEALETALAEAGLAAESLAALATVDLKADEPGLRQLAQQLEIELVVLPRTQLAALDPAGWSASAAQARFDLPGVAEPCAVLAAAGGPLLLPKRAFARSTVALALRDAPAVAQQDVVAPPPAAIASTHGSLTLIGIGPGDPRQFTAAAIDALQAAEVVIGYRVYAEQVRPLLATGQQLLTSPIGDEVARAAQAIELAAQGRRVALVSSGDIGIYAMAGPVFELLRQRGWTGDDPPVTVLPGISAVQAAAARLGAPISHDFCTISLSDLLTPWLAIERRLWAAARGDFVVALYNPRSRERDWQLARALAILRTYRPADTPVALARNVSRPDERITLTTLADVDPAQADMWTLVLIGNSQSYTVAGYMATPRGYTDAASPVAPASSALGLFQMATQHPSYPITLTSLDGAPAVVVGGGAVGERKVRGLLAAGAAVRLISPQANPGLRALAEAGQISWDTRPFQPGDLAARPQLVFAATNQRAVNQAVALEAAALGLLCNVADAPAAGTFHLPAVYRESGLVVAVSTAGESPARARDLRDRIAGWLAQESHDHER